MVLRLSLFKNVNNIILLSRLFNQFLKKIKLVETMISFKKMAWVANEIY
jgi:hypothetical protein